MTVKELIEELQKQPSHMTVVVDLHSEYSTPESVTRIIGYENGGYVSSSRGTPEEKLKEHGYVHIGWRS